MGKVIIDGDSYVYKAACTCNELIELEDGMYYEAYSLHKARDYIRDVVNTICSRVGTNDYVIVLAPLGSTNFRKIINPSYKSNRKKQAKPIMLDKVRGIVFEEFNTITIPHLEADDVVRILYENGEGNAIASIDKDLKTFPCKLYDSYHDVFSYVLPQQADANFKRQLLIGDATDGYKGIPKIGKATADKLLLDGITIDDIKQKYLDAGLTINDFKTTYNCAKILGKDDYNNGIIKLYDGEELDVRDKQEQHT